MTIATFAWATLACGLGSLVRHLVSMLDRSGAFPWPTIASNTVGSAAVGALAGAVSSGAGQTWMLVVGAGFAGGLTTFSSLAVDAVVLWREERRAATTAYLVATAGLGLAAAAAGWLTWSWLVA